MKTQAATILAFISVVIQADYNRPIYGVVPMQDLFPRQDVTECRAGEISCPADIGGCCDIGSTCTISDGTPLCSGAVCNEALGDTSCGDGTCCEAGYACPVDSGDICERTGTNINTQTFVQETSVVLPSVEVTTSAADTQPTNPAPSRVTSQSAGPNTPSTAPSPGSTIPVVNAASSLRVVFSTMGIGIVLVTGYII